MEKLSIYIHIPFCENKCKYCDFVSFAYKGECVEKYITSLVQEINDFDSSGYVVDSIFIGGGTPTFINEKYLASIFQAVKSNFKLDLKEFTIEGNPSSYTQEKVKFYQELGVTRLSVGVQSLNDEVLKGIGRIHNSKQACDCLKMLVQSGLDINCDMMIGLPYQTLNIVENDIKKVIDIGVNSVSCYSLILEEGTPLYDKVNSKQLVLPNDDLTVEMYDIAKITLQKSGLNRYEISNFGKPCLHNVGYWTLKEYVGFGLSAHSLIGNVRYYNTSDLCEYIAGSSRQVEEVLSKDDMIAEYIMLALRMDSGIDIGFMANKFGLESIKKLLYDIENNKKYYNITDKNIAIKDDYMYLSNSLITNLI